MTKYTLDELRKTEKTRSLPIWYRIIIYPISMRVLWIVANYTKLTPNKITIISFIFGIFSAFSFLQGTRIYLVIGAFLFETSYLFDCVDGKLARLKRLESGLGRYLDSMLDQTRIFFVVLCLVYGQYLLTRDVHYFLFGITYIFLYLIHWISQYECYIIKKKFYKEEKVDTNFIEDTQNKFPFIQKTKAYFDSKRISIFMSFGEADALAFFIFPILMQIKLGLLLGSAILFENILMEAYFIFMKGRSSVFINKSNTDKKDVKYLEVIK